MTLMLPSAAAPFPTHRLIPSRFPPIAAFDAVASADDAAAVMELEGWTNDRLVAGRVARLPRSEWIYGRPNASVIMAAFLHASPVGTRFAGSDLGAWYASAHVRTAVAEVAHHLRREATARRLRSLTRIYRTYVARLTGAYADLRGQGPAQPTLYDRMNYTASQRFGEELRAAGGCGIIYDSVRHHGGVNVVAYRPRHVEDVTQAAHYELIVPVTGRIAARELSA